MSAVFVGLSGFSEQKAAFGYCGAKIVIIARQISRILGVIYIYGMFVFVL